MKHEDAHRLGEPSKYAQYECAEDGDCGLGGRIFISDQSGNLLRHLASKHNVVDTPEVRQKYGIRAHYARKKPAALID